MGWSYHSLVLSAGVSWRRWRSSRTLGKYRHRRVVGRRHWIGPPPPARLHYQPCSILLAFTKLRAGWGGSRRVPRKGWWGGGAGDYTKKQTRGTEENWRGGRKLVRGSRHIILFGSNDIEGGATTTPGTKPELDERTICASRTMHRRRT